MAGEVHGTVDLPAVDFQNHVAGSMPALAAGLSFSTELTSAPVVFFNRTTPPAMVHFLDRHADASTVTFP